MSTTIKNFNALTVRDKLEIVDGTIDCFVACYEGSAYAFDVYLINNEYTVVTTYKRSAEVVAVDMLEYAELDNILYEITLPKEWKTQKK
jgi:hypothetical protein